VAVADAKRSNRRMSVPGKGGTPLVCLTAYTTERPVPKADDRSQWSQSLLLGHCHLAGDVGENRRLEDRALFVDAIASASDYAAFCDGIRDVGFDLGTRMPVDERCHPRIEPSPTER
jgi:hypothetical protein